MKLRSVPVLRNKETLNKYRWPQIIYEHCFLTGFPGDHSAARHDGSFDLSIGTRLFGP